MEAPQLKKLIEKLLKGALSLEAFLQIKATLESSERPKDKLILELIILLYLRGAGGGYSVQAAMLNEYPDLSSSLIDTWKEQALEIAPIILASMSTLLAAKLTKEAVRKWLFEVLRNTVQRGMDQGQATAAVQLGAETKTFIRFASAQEPRAHSSLEGMTIGIKEKFVLPAGSPNAGTKIAGPRDSVPAWAAEWRYCHHGLAYGREAQIILSGV